MRSVAHVAGLVCALSFCFPHPSRVFEGAWAADDVRCLDDAMLVFDGSGSMAGTDMNEVRPHIAKVREAIDITKRASGERDFMVAYYLDSLANLELKVGRTANALTDIETALDIYRETLPAEHLYIASAEYLLGEIFVARKEPAQAVEPLRHAIAVATQAKDAPQWRAARSQSTLGVALAQLGQDHEAEELLIASHRVLAKELGTDDALTRTAHQRALDFLRAHGRSHEAAHLLAVN